MGPFDAGRHHAPPPPPDSTGSSNSVAASFMTLEQKIEAMEKDVKQRLQAVAAAEREGAALREELARCHETRQALLKRWHMARIHYDEVQLQLLDTQGRMDAASKAIQDAQRLQARFVAPEAGCSALEEELQRAHALALGAEVPARVLKRFNDKLAAEAAAMRARQQERAAAHHALLQASLRGEGEQREMVRVHEEIVACRGAIGKQRAAKLVVQGELEAKQKGLENLKTKSLEMARRLQEEETAYILSAHTPSSASASASGPSPHPPPLPVSLPSRAALATPAADQAAAAAAVVVVVDEEEEDAAGGGYGYGGRSLAYDA